jgi:hypothetical protein
MEFARLPGHVAIAPPLVSGRDESTTTRCARNVNPSGARTRPDVAVCALLFAPRANKKKSEKKIDASSLDGTRCCFGTGLTTDGSEPTMSVHLLIKDLLCKTKTPLKEILMADPYRIPSWAKLAIEGVYLPRKLSKVCISELLS